MSQQVNFNISRTDVGIVCVSAAMPERQSLATGIWFRVGSRYENSFNSGISHFIEHMLFKGTQNRSCLDISKAIEGIGGSINAFTSEEYTCYTAAVLERHADKAFDILSDMILCSALDEKEINQERKVIKEELKMHKDNPSSYVYDLIGEVLWPDQPLGRQIVGNNKSLDNINGDTIREFMKTFYCPENIVVSVSGATSHNQVAELTQKFLPMKKSTTAVPGFDRVVEDQQGPRFIVRKKDTEQVHLCLAFRSFERKHPDRFALKLLSVILGENMSSRLFQEIREKRGLSYDIQSGINSFLDTGILTISAGVESDRLGPAISVILEECARMKTGGVTEDELTRAKEYIYGRLIMGAEKTFRNMLWAAEYFIYHGSIPTMEETIAQIEKITAADIKRVAGFLFDNSRLNAAVYGPAKENDEQIEGLLKL